MELLASQAGVALALAQPPPPLPPRTKWTRRVPHPVLIGHASSHQAGVALALAQQRADLTRGKWQSKAAPRPAPPPAGPGGAACIYFILFVLLLAAPLFSSVCRAAW